MDMNNFFRGESHVAQQSRRDKLRVQSSENLEHFYPNSLEQLSVVHHPDMAQLRNIKYGTLPYDPPMLSSNMVNFVSKNSQVLLPRNDSLVSSDNASIANFSHPMSSNLRVSSATKMSGNDPHNCSNRKSMGSQQNCDWILNNYHNNNPTSISESARNPLLSEGEGSGSLKINNISASSLYMKQPNSYGYNDMVQSSLVARPSGEMQLCGSFYNYQNSLQEVVASVNVGHQGQDMVRYGGRDSNELRLLPSYSDHQSSQALACNASAVWVNRPVEVFRSWDGQDHGNKSDGQQMTIGDGSNTQGLSLSLSSVPTTKTSEGQFGERNSSSEIAELNALKSEYLCSSSWQSVGNKTIYGINRSNSAGTSAVPHRDAAGPLGPFTGYATILKNSKYLKPTLQLMDDLFRVTGTKQIETGDIYSDKNSDETAISAGHSINPADENMVGVKGIDSCVSSSTFYSSNGISREARGRGDATECYHHDYHQKKTKLLYMQEELCRRYRQYHQQMQMVVASFESVAGLSAATPYISVALKSVSRHFRGLKHAISEQLKHMGRKLGDEFSSPTVGTSSTTGRDLSNSGLKLIEHQKQQSCGGNMIFFEPQQPVWRPQRGLPERAVAVLRAWLFDHFLHPYPTDTDKHMLATQTGLTRNQVSNWFINARVRVWKPMVEEIHVLETKGLAESSSQACKADRNKASENPSNQHSFPGTDSLRCRDMASAEVWNQEKRSRHESHIPANMDDGSLMSFLPYHRGGLEIGGGLGAVSLTLGLRQSAESAHHQQQDQYQQHFGEHMIHDFVG